MKGNDDFSAADWPVEDERRSTEREEQRPEGAYGDRPHAPHGGTPRAGAPETDDHDPYGDEGTDLEADINAAMEADILRAELKTIVEQFRAQDELLKEAEDRLLRTRAEMDTMRRRMQGEVELARNEGVNRALAPALSVFDDLERALTAAERTDDPGSIVPGVRAVRDALLRNLAALDVKLVGQPGEAFDPNLHEALTVVPLRPGATPGTIDQVVEAGFAQGQRLVRVARVTVFAD